MHVLFLNCTIKTSPKRSNTRALCDDVARVYTDEYDTTCEVIRITDYHVPPGVVSRIDDDDEWPHILKRIKNADIIIVATPIWLGNISSVAQRVFERLEGTYAEGDTETGQYPLYNKVGGALITGTEDGGHFCAKTINFCLDRFGCTIPAGADCYWVGPAGPGPSYIEAEGNKHLYTNRTKRTLVANTMHMAQRLREHPYPTNLNTIEEQARAESHQSNEINWRGDDS